METGLYRYIRYIRTFRQYSFLLSLLVKTEMKRKYKGSFLGVLWSLLNPLLHMIILTLVFSTVFRTSIEQFPVYLLSGHLLFGFFSSSTMSSMSSLVSSAHLFSKVYIPKYILTLSKLLSEFIFFVISLMVFAGILLIFNFHLTVHAFLSPIYIVLLFIFCVGISFFLATATVFFRDVEYLYGVIVTIFMYSSALFYPPDIIPQKYQFLLSANPVYPFIKGFRDALYYGVPLDEINLLKCVIISLTSFVLGVYVFERNQDKFILRL